MGMYRLRQEEKTSVRKRRPFRVPEFLFPFFVYFCHTLEVDGVASCNRKTRYPGSSCIIRGICPAGITDRHHSSGRETRWVLELCEKTQNSPGSARKNKPQSRIQIITCDMLVLENVKFPGLDLGAAEEPVLAIPAAY